MDNLKPGYKKLPSNITVYLGSIKYKNSCPENIHPDSFKPKSKSKSQNTTSSDKD